jgi:hypothetical protein
MAEHVDQWRKDYAGAVRTVFLADVGDGLGVGLVS